MTIVVVSINTECLSGLTKSRPITKILPRLPGFGWRVSDSRSFPGTGPLPVTSRSGIGRDSLAITSVPDQQFFSENTALFKVMGELNPRYFLMGASTPRYEYLLHARSVSASLKAELIPFLMGDLYGGYSVGYSYRKSIDFKKLHCEGFQDQSGFLNLYAQMQLLTLKHPVEEIQFHLSLNNSEQLSDLNTFLKKHLWLIPRRLTLQLYQHSRSWGLPIKGNGSVDRDYRRRVYQMADAAEKFMVPITLFKLSSFFPELLFAPSSTASTVSDLPPISSGSSTTQALSIQGLPTIVKAEVNELIIPQPMSLPSRLDRQLPPIVRSGPISQTLSVNSFEELFSLFCLPLHCDQILQTLPKEIIKKWVSTPQQLFKLLELPPHLFSEAYRNDVITILFDRVVEWTKADARCATRLISLLPHSTGQSIRQENERLKRSLIASSIASPVFQLPPLQGAQAEPCPKPEDLRIKHSLTY